MTASHRGGLGDGPPHMVASGRWRGHNDRPVDLTAARRRVAVRDIATGTVPIAVGWVPRPASSQADGPARH